MAPRASCSSLVKTTAPYLAATLPLLTLAGLAGAGVGGPPEGALAVALTVAALVALGGCLVALERAARSPAWLAASVALASSVLGVPLVAALAAPADPVASFDAARLEHVESLARAGAWAALIASAVLAGAALAASLVAARRCAPDAWLRALLAALFAIPVPLCVVWSSAGYDWAYSALRWGPLAWTLLAAVIAAAGRADERAADHAMVLLAVVATLSVLSAWAFVEPSMIAAASAASFMGSIAEHAVQTETETFFGWRLPLVPLLALLPLVSRWLLTEAGRRRMGVSLAAASAALALGVLLLFAGVEARAHAAEAATFDAMDHAHVVMGDESAAWVRDRAIERDGRRVLMTRLDGPRDVAIAPVARAAEAEDVELRFLVRRTDDSSRAIIDGLRTLAPPAVPVVDAQRIWSVRAEVVPRCVQPESISACRSLDDVMASEVIRLAQREGSTSLSLTRGALGPVAQPSR